MADRENIYAVIDIDWETDGEHIDLSGDLSFLNKWKGRLDITGYDLLHGYCNIFAKALNEEFGYRMFRVVDGYGTLVHCYACGTESGRLVYIDVRGKTPDYSTFISEFKRWTTEEDSLRNTKPMNPDDVYIPWTGYSEAAHELSLRIIRAFPHRYQTNI